MNTTKTVYNRLFSKKTELETHKIELANVKDINNAINAYKEAETQITVAESFYKQSKKAFEEFENTWSEYSARKSFAEESLKKGKSFEKEINEIEKTAKDLGLDVKQIKGYQEYLKLKSNIEKEFQKINKFKYPAK